MCHRTDIRVRRLEGPASFLNYALLLLVYAPQAIEEIEIWFSELAFECQIGMPKPGFWGQITDGFFRSLSPMF